MTTADHDPVVATSSLGTKHAAPIRTAVLLAGTAGIALLSVWTPLLERQGDELVLAATDSGLRVGRIPTWLLAVIATAIVLGGLGLIEAVWRDPRVHASLKWAWRWATTHPGWCLLIAASVAAGTVDVYELLYDPFARKPGLRPWMLREDLQVWLLLCTTVLGALAISAASPGSTQLDRFTNWLTASTSAHPVRWWIAAAGVPVVLGAAMCLGALEGIPHFSDALTYLMQGRVLYNGRLWLPAPKHPDLFIGSLFFVETDGRFYGKYPIGWPAILGTFDRLGIGYLANAAMAGVATILTGLVANRFTSRRVSVLAAVVFGLSPWVWFNGAGFASHVAATCAVTAFMWLFLRTLDTSSAVSALGAGLALGAAVLIRPFDAAMFALPAVFVVLVCQARWPKQWIGLGTLIAMGAMVGVGIYLWANLQTTGGAFKSAYTQESRWGTDWNPTPLSMLGRLAFQWTELNGRFPGWGIGGLTVAILGAIAAGPLWRQSGLRLLAAATVLFFLGSTVFGFTNVWWGPRWLLPVTPLLAILAAVLIDRVLTQLRPPLTGEIKDQGATAASQMALCIVLAGVAVGFAGRYVGQFYQHRMMPPHMVSGAANKAVHNKYISNAVIGMPPVGERAPLDARAGLVFMDVPFEKNQVIYVRATPNWQQKAKQSYPGRALFEIKPDRTEKQGFVIKPLTLQ